LEVFWEPLGSLLAVAGPYVAFLHGCRRHDLKGRKCHLLFFMNELAPELHPGRLYGKRCRAAEIAELAGGADQYGVHHLLVPLLLALHILSQPVPLAPWALALPSAAVELIAFIHTVAALGAAVGIPGDIGRDIPNIFLRPLPHFSDNGITERPDERLEYAPQLDGSPYESSSE